MDLKNMFDRIFRSKPAKKSMSPFRFLSVLLLDWVFQHWSPRNVKSRHKDCLTKPAIVRSEKRPVKLFLIGQKSPGQKVPEVFHRKSFSAYTRVVAV